MDYIKRLQIETNNLKDIVYRKKKIKGKIVWIIYSDSLTSGSSISDFIIKSLDRLNKVTSINLASKIKEDIYNFKVIEIDNYDDMCTYLHSGFTIILIEKEKKLLALETKSSNKRSIGIPTSEIAIRGSKDAFTEDYQTNIGLIKRRIKSNNLWIKEVNIGKYTNTIINILYINGKADISLVNKIYDRLKNTNIDGVLNGGTIKNIIGESNINPMPTIMSTERPDRVCRSLLRGKIVILVDNDPYLLILPEVLNDFFKTSEDYSGKPINTSLTRILRYLSFYIALFTPAIYIALITYNQEMLPTEFLINFAMQRSTVPFPAFFEAFMMMICFELLHESDIRSSGFAGSSLSIVGALILGEAASKAGIVSPIMIIIIALTAIASLPFNEYEIFNGLRWYRILFMIGASSLGIIGVVFSFIYFIINMISTNSFGMPYLTPFVPTNLTKLKDSIIRINPRRQ